MHTRTGSPTPKSTYVRTYKTPARGKSTSYGKFHSIHLYTHSLRILQILNGQDSPQRPLTKKPQHGPTKSTRGQSRLTQLFKRIVQSSIAYLFLQLKAQAHLQSKVLKERESFSSSSCFYLRRVSRRKIPPAKSPGKVASLRNLLIHLNF
jgi:hypothetical protein